MTMFVGKGTQECRQALMLWKMSLSMVNENMLAALRNEWGVMSRYRGGVNGCVGSEQRATGIEIVGNRWPTMTTIDLKLKIDNHGLI